MAYVNEHLLFRKCGFVFLVEEGPGWFPAEELRQFYELPAQYEVSKAEKVLLGFNEVNWSYYATEFYLKAYEACKTSNNIFL